MGSKRGFVSTLGLAALLACGSDVLQPPTVKPPEGKPPAQQQNHAPIITSSCPAEIDEHNYYECRIQAHDPDGDVINYNFEGPSWLSISNNLVYGNSPEVQKDSIFPVKIKVSDGKLITEQKYDLTVKNIYNVYVLNQTQINTINSVKDSVISFSQPLNLINKGDIIGIPITPQTPNGFIGEVTDFSADKKTIKTTQATLEQMVDSASISYSQELSPSNVQHFESLPGISMAPSTTDAFKFMIKIKDVVLFDLDRNLDTKGDQLIANGDISFNTSFNFDLGIKRFKLEKLLLQNTTNGIADVALNSDISGFASLGQITIAKYYFPPIILGYLPPPTPMPIIVLPKLEVNIEINPTKVNPIGIKLKQEASLTAKLGYNRDWFYSADFSNKFDYSLFYPGGEWGLGVFAGPSLDLLLYGVAGPFTSVLAGVKFTSQTGNWKLYGGLRAFAGANVKVLGKKIVSYAKNILDYEKLLAEGSGSSGETEEKILFRSMKENDFTDYDGLYLINTNGFNPKKIPNSSDIAYASWSPDGKRIVFHAKKNNNSDIYVMDLDGSNLKRLTYNVEDDFFPTFSPDGKEILFVSYKRTSYPQYNGLRIWIMNSDGTNQREIKTPYPYGQHDFASWSPDGKKIIYSVQGTNDGCSICIINKDGTQPTTLVRRSSLDNHDGYFPFWSPDGSKVLFETFKDENREVYVVNSDGSGIKNLTNNPAFDAHPSWSRDGKFVLFVSDRESGYNTDIYIMNSDGTGQRKLFGNSSYNSDPFWSPVPIK